MLTFCKFGASFQRKWWPLTTSAVCNFEVLQGGGGVASLVMEKFLPDSTRKGRQYQKGWFSKIVLTSFPDFALFFSAIPDRLLHGSQVCFICLFVCLFCIVVCFVLFCFFVFVLFCLLFVVCLFVLFCFFLAKNKKNKMKIWLNILGTVHKYFGGGSGKFQFLHVKTFLTPSHYTWNFLTTLSMYPKLFDPNLNVP